MVMDRLSALMDGELDDREAQNTMARLRSDVAFRARWDEFHLVRDALHGEPILSAGFGERLSKRLAEEPTVLAPRRLLPRTRRALTYALSAAASVAAAALVLSVAMPQFGPDAQTQTASLKPVSPTATVEPAAMPPSVPYDGRMNELLLAHEVFSPSTALQGLAPYMRTVSTTVNSADRR
jgi:sigma-E factor negative regulatory protein RseA